MRIAQQSGVGPFLDVAAAAAHFHRVAGNPPRIAARPELDQRREDACQRSGTGFAGVGAGQRARSLKDHGAGLLGRQHHLEQLTAHQGQLDQRLAEGHPVPGHMQRFGECTAHQSGCPNAIGQARVVDHVGHLLKAATALADQPGGGAFEADLAAGHRTRAELVLEAQDAIAVGRAIGQGARQQKERDAFEAGVGVGRFAAGQHHGKTGVRVGAEPLVALQRPARVRALLRKGGGAGHIRPRALLGHEHRTLVQGIEVEGGEQRQAAFDEFGLAIAAQRAGERVGHRDRAAQTEFGLHQQIGQGIFGGSRHELRPAEHARAMRHRRQTEIAIGDALHLDIGRMLDDPRFVGTAPVAHRQGRRVLVADRGELVERPAGQRPEPVEMRLEMRKKRRWQIEPEERCGHRICPIEVAAAGIGDGIGADRRGGGRLSRAARAAQVHRRVRLSRRSRPRP